VTVVSQRTNVSVPASPPAHFYPNSNGDPIPAGGVRWRVTVDSASYAAGSTADFTVQYQYNGVWQDDLGVSGFTLGSRTDKFGNVVTTNNLGSKIGVTANPYPDRGRIRIDVMPAGTADSITLEIF
jgi:hypothetical protein